MINPEYIRFGEEWKAEMRKLPKDVIINICCQLGIEKQQCYNKEDVELLIRKYAFDFEDKIESIELGNWINENLINK